MQSYSSLHLAKCYLSLRVWLPCAICHMQRHFCAQSCSVLLVIDPRLLTQHVLILSYCAYVCLYVQFCADIHYRLVHINRHAFWSCVHLAVPQVARAVYCVCLSDFSYDSVPSTQVFLTEKSSLLRRRRCLFQPHCYCSLWIGYRFENHTIFNVRRDISFHSIFKCIIIIIDNFAYV